MVLAIIQARMGSSRLPGKILKDVAGKPMLWYVVDRVRQSKAIDRVVVATSISSEDDAVELFCQKAQVDYFRGSESDVLGRFYEASQKFGGDVLFRITADCPLVDPKHLTALYEFFIREGLAYSGFGESFPDGFNGEIFTKECLRTSFERAKEPREREHVTPFMKAHPELFNSKPYDLSQTAADFGFPELAKLNHLLLSLDEPYDFEVLSTILQNFYPARSDFSLQDVLELIKKRKCPAPRTDARGSAVGYLEGLKKEQRK